MIHNQERTYKVKKIDRCHANSKVVMHGKGGRKLKQWQRVYTKASYKRVDCNFASQPKTKNVVASGQNKDSIDISYLGAYKSISRNRALETIGADKFYQKLNKFMSSFANINPGSVVDVSYDEHNRVTKVFVCPRIMNDKLQFVKRVILIDACYHKSYLLFSQ